ncbi:hypothetical protein [Sphingomonas sp. KC8]|uniref:hypothetical protein n=1 Tax=Sphingomonas sp. KC8 TaxID=1030157 RepID=UPI000248938E|nr:hypothetical protein [Sphingomonas sp. KC8]
MRLIAGKSHQNDRPVLATKMAGCADFRKPVVKYPPKWMQVVLELSGMMRDFINYG